MSSVGTEAAQILLSTRTHSDNKALCQYGGLNVFRQADGIFRRDSNIFDAIDDLQQLFQNSKIMGPDYFFQRKVLVVFKCLSWIFSALHHISAVDSKLIVLFNYILLS